MTNRLVPEELILKRELLQLIPLSYPTIWRMERRNEFPLRIMISPGRIAWRRSEIEKWLKDRQSLPNQPFKGDSAYLRR